MKLLQETIFISEIVFQSKLAQRAAENLKVNSENFDSLGIWSSVQSILIAAGNISKILRPKEKYEKRGKKLRSLLKIDDNSILLKRKFRNQFEHYDDLIDEYFENGNIVSYIDLAMNPSMSSFGTNFCHRGYNSYNNTLVIRGETLDLNAVLEAVEEIKAKCGPYTLT